MTSTTTTTTAPAPSVDAPRHEGAAFWDRLAEKYARQPVANPGAFERKIAITRALMGPDSVVLDAGCGTGSLALRLASAGAEVHGLDISSEMIRIARGKAQAAGDAAVNVTFHEGVLDDTFDALAPGSLDGVCAYSILHLLQDPGDALARMHRLLAPGGFLVASTACLRESWVPYAPILKVMRWMGKAPWVGHLSKEDVRELVTRAGFVDITEPDVGAEKSISFVVAHKPG
ncbi:MAG: class I SAM-dependent methyltransferase [Myxococcales bacterium]|nr:class I SAM-dependent methyltransferase [Myxococcales bacterium]